MDLEKDVYEEACEGRRHVRELILHHSTVRN